MVPIYKPADRERSERTPRPTDQGGRYMEEEEAHKLGLISAAPRGPTCDGLLGRVLVTE
jgi:hypothetical protein